MMPMAMRRKPSKLEKVENARRYSCARKIMLVNGYCARRDASPAICRDRRGRRKCAVSAAYFTESCIDIGVSALRFAKKRSITHLFWPILLAMQRHAL